MPWKAHRVSTYRVSTITGTETTKVYTITDTVTTKETILSSHWSVQIQQILTEHSLCTRHSAICGGQ